MPHNRPFRPPHLAISHVNSAGLETEKPVGAGLPDNVLPVFGGLVFGMVLAALNLTLIAPALPAIAAELGAVGGYSWLVLANILASTVVVPVVGKLSDLYGRKPFYLGGIAVFGIGAALSGVAPSFEFLVFARVVQGLGMGAMMPLSQAIIGDLIPPRDRGKYQGIMGAAFGIASIFGPLLGGLITHYLSWRWLFLINVPLAVLAIFIVQRYMRLPFVAREHSIDVMGFVTLAVALVALLLTMQLGGTRYPWGSVQIIALGVIGITATLLFVWVEQRADEPILPTRLWLDRAFTFSNVATLGIGMAMFGAIFFVPVFLQGVLGFDAAQAGTRMLPLLLGMIVASIAAGQLISITGLYKLQTLAGLLATATCFWVLTHMEASSANGLVFLNLGILGAGLGLAMPTYTVVVQSTVNSADMGTATATNQLFRSIGATIGVAVMGNLMAQGLAADFESLSMTAFGQGARLSAATALDPAMLAQLTPSEVLTARARLANVLDVVFTAGLPFVLLAFVTTLLIPETPLRRAERPSLREAGKEVLVELNQAGEDDAEPVLNEARAEAGKGSEPELGNGSAATGRSAAGFRDQDRDRGSFRRAGQPER